jgi:hypothetical protein
VLKSSNDAINRLGIGRGNLSSSHKPTRYICDKTTEPDAFINQFVVWTLVQSMHGLAGKAKHDRLCSPSGVRSITILGSKPVWSRVVAPFSGHSSSPKTVGIRP